MNRSTPYTELCEKAVLHEIRMVSGSAAIECAKCGKSWFMRGGVMRVVSEKNQPFRV